MAEILGGMLVIPRSGSQGEKASDANNAWGPYQAGLFEMNRIRINRFASDPDVRQIGVQRPLLG